MLIYCDVEKHGFKSIDIVRLPGGIAIHPLTPREGHTTRGRHATFEGVFSASAGWKLKNIAIGGAPIDEIAEALL